MFTLNLKEYSEKKKEFKNCSEFRENCGIFATCSTCMHCFALGFDYQEDGKTSNDYPLLCGYCKK